MMKNRGMVALIGLVFGLMMVLSMGCASTVRINSSPEGASVTVDGVYIGETPTTYTDTSIIFTNRFVEVEKPGYRKTQASLARDSQVNVGALIGGFFLCGILWLWALDYPAVVTYELRREGRADLPEGFETFDWDYEVGAEISYQME